MMTDTNAQVTKRDISLIRHTLYRLTAMQKLLSVLIIAIVALGAWVLGKHILAFGDSIDYSALHMLGDQTLGMLNEYNPFFWWGATIIMALIVIYLLAGIVAAMQRRTRSRLVRQPAAQRLVGELSPAGRDVLAWSWENRREPITVGVLQRTLTEMRTGRDRKIDLVNQQTRLFGRPDSANDSSRTSLLDSAQKP